MKKTRLICLILIANILFVACSFEEFSNTQEKSTLKVGITMYDEFDPFTTEIAESIISNLKEKETDDLAVTTSLLFSNKSQLLQNEQVEEFINKGYDVICVNLVDRTDPSVIIDKATAAGIPIIFFNRELVEDDLNRANNLYYVGAKPVSSGQLQAKIVNEILSDEEKFQECDFNHDGVIQYVLLEGEAGHQDAMVRSRVSVDMLKQYGIPLERLGDEIANWDRKQAQTKMKSMLAGYPWQIELVLANDDNMALGVIDALENEKTSTWPLIVGVNGQQEALSAIINHKMSGTVYNNAQKKGEIIATMSYCLATKNAFPDDIELHDNKYVYVPYEMINESNVDEYVK